ncbi:hypothetical protein NQ315_009938 [Exocentrus adspersus]|uniref:Protein CASC3 n=1 Tax=Exocentrus adspersus TaxID=1586481 RepID=A0AAV8WJ11_9CUCU|nr:hypothetical protein NQ315_009938 [Exocentrus adspersus]
MEATTTLSHPSDNNDSNSNEKEVVADATVEEKEESPDNSDYDSAGSYSEEGQDVKIRSRASEHSNSDTSGSVILEREEGDGQESAPARKVDDDEDKKNPQYIPKRGTFYEHDDRTTDDVETIDPVEAEKEKEAKKKVWQDKKEKWKHDRFNDTEQAPKSRSELIAIYGYDIRNEDGPPRARRRRRYGRGPNKYTRNWEDEDAYSKPATATRPKKLVRPKRTTDEEFPPLVRTKSPEREKPIENDAKPEEAPVQRPPQRSEPSREHITDQAPPVVVNTAPVKEQQEPPAQNRNNSNNQPRPGSGRIVKPKKEIKDSDYRGFTTKTRQQRGIKTDQQKVLPPRTQPQPKEDVIHSQNFTNKNNMHDVEKEMGKLSVDGNFKGPKQHGNQRQGSVPPRLQSEQKGPKRYSSMRQRSLPEANTPPAPNYQHTSFYPNDNYQQAAPQPAPQQAILHQSPQMHPPPAAQLPTIAQVPVTAAPLLQTPFPQAFPQPPPAFLQAGVPPPPLFPAQTPQIINYVQGQPPFTPNFQGYQQQFNPVTQPTELYQPQGGITYYSTDQQVVQRPAVQKRPKAAIPIVAPPSDERRDESVDEYARHEGDETEVVQ